MEWLAPVAVSSGGVVLAVAHQRTPGARRYTLGRVSVALAPAAHGQIGNGVMIRTAGRRRYSGRGRDDCGFLWFVSLKFLVRVQHEQVGAGLVAVQMVVDVRFVVYRLKSGGGGGGGTDGGGSDGRGRFH